MGLFYDKKAIKMSLNQKINSLSIAIVVLLGITIGLQSLMRSDQLRRKNVMDQNYTRIFKKLDSLTNGQKELNGRFDSLIILRH
jgi:hypothetical protein